MKLNIVILTLFTLFEVAAKKAEVVDHHTVEMDQIMECS